MREQLEQRLQSLKAEYQSGQNRVAELETELAGYTETLMRIAGAIQVIEEMLAEFDEA